MDDRDRAMHLAAGEMYGQLSACGKKQDHGSEEAAEKAAASAGRRFGRDFEAYPCFWCSGWHFGRRMTESERVRFYLSG